MSNCILKSDDVFAKMNEISNETRRWLVGKYNTEEKYKVDFRKSIPRYQGPEICHLEFDFTSKGTRCFWCNTFCLLTSDGKFNHQEVITIGSGSYKGQQLTIQKSEIPEVEFGTYEPIKAIGSDFLPIAEVSRRHWMQNKCSFPSHELAISSLVNSNIFPFKCRALGAWICRDVNLVKLVPTLGNFKNAIFTRELFRNTFFQIFMLSVTNNFSHGDPSSTNLFLSNIPSVFTAGNKKISMNSTLFFDLSEFSSFTIDYDKRLLFFVGKEANYTQPEPNWNFKFTLTNEKVIPKKLTRSPCKPSYLAKRLITFVPSMSVMNYIRATGFNVFPQLYFIIYMTIALCNKTFYEQFMASKALNLYRCCFVDNDFNRYLNLITSKQDKEVTTDQIIDMLDSNQIEIRYDLFDLIKMEVLGFMTE